MGFRAAGSWTQLLLIGGFNHLENNESQLG
jgi:hypothetical protein